MPQNAWSQKRERQYEHVKESELDAGRSEDRAEEIAARTVNKQRAESGEAKSSSTKSKSSASKSKSSGSKSKSGSRSKSSGSKSKSSSSRSKR
jgi:hypothetical protein